MGENKRANREKSVKAHKNMLPAIKCVASKHFDSLVDLVLCNNFTQNSIEM